MMKKIFAGFMAGLLGLIGVGCRNQDQNSSVSQTTDELTTSTAEDAETTAMNETKQTETFANTEEQPQTNDTVSGNAEKNQDSVGDKEVEDLDDLDERQENTAADSVAEPSVTEEAAPIETGFNEAGEEEL